MFKLVQSKKRTCLHMLSLVPDRAKLPLLCRLSRLNFRKKQLLSAMIPLVIIMSPPVSFNQPFKDITLEGMDHAAQANCYLFTGWTQAHLLRIAHLWSEDKWVKFEGRFFPRDLALMVGFERLRSGANFTSFVSKYGGEGRRWSEAFSWFINKAFEFARVFEHKDAMLRYAHQGFQFNDAITKTMEREKGFVATLAEGTTCCIIDGVNFTCCNPCDVDLQGALYSGYKKNTGLNVQVIVLPNGMTARIDICAGSCPDHSAVKRRDINAHVRAFSNAVNYLAYHRGDLTDNIIRVLSAYGDQIYACMAFIRSPHSPDRRYSPAVHQQFPELVARMKLEDAAKRYVRSSVEHAFASVKNEMRYIGIPLKHSFMRNGLQFPKLIAVMFFIADLKTIMKGNQRNEMFRLPPPSLSEYIDGLRKIMEL